MTMTDRIDCLTIGYNDPPLEQYESLIGKYGHDSEAYRDLKFSFIDLAGRKLSYVDLLNEVMRRAGHQNVSFASGEIPNLAAAYLTNYLQQRDFKAEYVNLYQLEKERLVEQLARDPLCVAITTTFYVVNFPVTEMIEFIRQHNDRVKVIVGGPLVSNHTRNYSGDDLQAALADMGADIYVVESQGEASLAHIVECLKSDRDLSSVPNLYLLQNGQYAATDAEAESNDLNENFIDWQKFSDGALGPTLQTRTARSCAFSCAFCNYPARAGKLTLASLETIELELDSMAALGNVENVVFIDDTFNVPLPRFKDICRLMIRKNYGFNWFSYFRCSNSDEEAFELMAESGCKGVFLGIESGSSTILTNMAKHATIEKYRHGIERLHHYGILTFGSYILGFPGETLETVEETLDFIEATGVDYYRIQMWYNESGTPIAKKRDQFDIAGDGFVWSHSTMDSIEAMEEIERSFLRIHQSEWLPQWSFDFWFIPYAMGKGMSLPQFKEFMSYANKMLRLEIATVAPREKRRMQDQYMGQLVERASRWQLGSKDGGRHAA